MSVSAAPSAGVVRWGVNNRTSIATVASADLASLRNAFTAVYGIADDRGYQHHAGIHGLPLPGYCVHHDAAGLLGGTAVGPLFLPWHRAYLYFFELALQDQVPGVTLPWWDWTTPPGQPSKLPDAYAAAMVEAKPNPLYQGPIAAIPDQQWSKQRQQLQADTGIDPGPLPATTFRQPGQLPQAPRNLPTPDDVAAVLNAANYVDFTQRLERVHDAVHVWIGGTMSEIPVAAYDPLFWAHHTMIDRLWSIWQLSHPGADPPARYLPAPLAPFPSLTVKDTLSVNALGYDYALSEMAAQPATANPAGP